MKIQTPSTFAAYSYNNASSLHKQRSADETAHFSASGATISDKVSISRTAQKYLTAQSDSEGGTGNSTTAIFDTDQGAISLDIDDYFSPGGKANGPVSLSHNLPPMLLPSKKNIDALSKHISAIFPQFLAQNNIPSAPSSISYDNEGHIQLPSDYKYAAELKQALENDPVMSKKLSTVNALTSHYVGIQKAIKFQQEYAAATTQEEANAVVARFSYIFSGDTQDEFIALEFSKNGRLSLTHNGTPLS